MFEFKAVIQTLMQASCIVGLQRKVKKASIK
jgi:hypothetical protein